MQLFCCQASPEEDKEQEDSFSEKPLTLKRSAAQSSRRNNGKVVMSRPSDDKLEINGVMEFDKDKESYYAEEDSSESGPNS